jgi:hypothetical protein
MRKGPLLFPRNEQAEYSDVSIVTIATVQCSAGQIILDMP